MYYLRMNKRISTLMASVLLASAFSASAANDLKVGDFVRLKNHPDATDLFVGIGIDENGLPTGKLKNAEKFVDLTTGVTGETEAEKLAKVRSNLDKAKAQIWKVAKVTTSDGGLKSYQFTNKLTNEYLAIDLGTANNAGADASLKASGNKDWYMDANGHLYIYKSSVDSTYSLTTSGGNLTITREEGSTSSGLAFTLDNTTNPEVEVTKALVWNGLMGAKGHDGKLHFNGEDVTSSYTNILKDTKWVAVKESTDTDGNFFLTDGSKTPINKNPYMLMVDYDSYDLSTEYFKLTTDTLTVPKTGEDNSAEAIAKGNYDIDNYSFPEAAETKVDKLIRPINAALWSAKYYLLNDSISLTPKGLPKKNDATKDYISDGFKVLKAVSSGAVGATNALVTESENAGTVSTNDGDTGTALDVLIAAVTNWIKDDAAGKSDQAFPTTSGLKKTFAQTRFTPAGAVASTADDGADANEKKGSDLIAAAKDQLANTTATTEGPVNATVLAGAKKYVEAVTYLRRVKSGETPEKYFERGVVHQPANTSSEGYAVALVKALSERILSVAKTRTDDKASAPLIQPYVSAPTGDAEITADAKLFFLQVKNTDQKFLRATSETDKYVVSYAAGGKELVDYVDNANPNAQWVFIPNAAGSYSIINRATEYPLYSGMVQKVKDAAGNVVADTYVIGTDTLKLGAVTLSTDAVYEEKDGDDKVKYDYAGYFYAGPQDGKTMTFGIAPVSPFMSTLAMQVKADSTVVLGEAENAPVWYFDQVTGEAYGVKIAGLPRLKSVAYKVYMKDADGKKYYVVPDADTKTFVITKEDSKVGNTYKNSTTAGLLFRTVAKDMYLISNGTAAGNYKMTINSTPEQPIIEATLISNDLKNDYFTVGKATANIYRTLTAEDGVNGNAKIYMQYEPNRFLYENTANIVANNGNKVAKDSLNFLGIFHAMEMDKNAALYIDTAYVEREGNIMPQYMLAVGVEDVEAHAVIPCTEAGVHIDKDGKPTTADKCVHATAATKGYKSGRYLVFVDDSIPAGVTKHPALYDGAKRFAFVPAKHYLGEDSLVIDNSKWTGNTNVLEAGKSKTYASKDTIQLSDDLTKATFALKIKDQESKSFYLQTAGGYVRILNGVPVWTDKIDDAAVFNIAATDEEATANEAIEAAGVQVIGGKGAVTVQGAAGKVITVANILGQTIANQVAASDNVTIAAPAGIVVVAVEGEATKVVVK